jgi:hypothetical protein
MEGVVRRGVVAVWLSACGLGCNGGPTGPPDTGGTDLPYADLTIGDTFAAACAADGTVDAFTVTSPQSELIEVVHTGYEFPDCGTYTVFVDRPELWRLVLDYGRILDTAEECAQECTWTFSYKIKVDPGDWTIELLNLDGGPIEKATVTVQ